MPGCQCTTEQLAANGGHIPGCLYHRPAPAPPPNAGNLSVLPVPRAAYTAPALVPLTEGDARYPVAHALALLVRARDHVPDDLAGEITAFLHSSELPPPTPSDTLPPPPAADTGPLPDDVPDDEDPAPLEAFARMPGTRDGVRAQVGPVMPAPPPPAPAFVMPPPRTVRRPPYSNGCSHPGQRLQPNGRGMTCLDCSTEFPGFAP